MASGTYLLDSGIGFSTLVLQTIAFLSIRSDQRILFSLRMLSRICSGIERRGIKNHILFSSVYRSRIVHAAYHCLTDHARISSGAIIVQIIILILLHNAFHLFPCNVLGCTEIHAQRRVVDRQIQIMLRRDLWDAQFSVSSDPNCVEGSARR
jgi:hypothetical protein